MAGRSPFTLEFKAAHAALGTAGYSGDWRSVVEKLAKLTDDLGPHDAYEPALDEARKKAEKVGSKSATEAEALLVAAGAYDARKPADGSKLTANSRKRLAALKLMRHLRLMRKRGGHQVWVLGLARSLRAWPSEAMASADLAGLKTLLVDTSEPFSSKDRKHLADASQEALKYVQKTLIVLATAGSKDGKKAAPGLELIKRWFAYPGVSPDDLVAAAGTLSEGFKKIQAVLNSGKLLLTDHPEVRKATDAENKRFWKSEAFVKGAREGMDVIYIESAFFKKGTNTLSGLKNWARILVHELSHREVGTEDKFYSWEGMKPVAGTFPMSDALVNADSWAFFCVDAAGQLTKSERNVALAT